MQIVEVLEGASAMPRSSPSYPCRQYRYTNCEHMLVTYRTDPAAVERLTPKPLLVDEPVVRCKLIRMECSTKFGHYSGAAQLIPVGFGEQELVDPDDFFGRARADISAAM